MCTYARARVTRARMHAHMHARTHSQRRARTTRTTRTTHTTHTTRTTHTHDTHDTHGTTRTHNTHARTKRTHKTHARTNLVEYSLWLTHQALGRLCGSALDGILRQPSIHRPHRAFCPVFYQDVTINNEAFVWFSSRTLETAQLAQHLLLKTNPDQPENLLPQVCSDPSPAVGLYLLCSTCASVCPELPSCREPLPRLHAEKAAPVQQCYPLGLFFFLACRETKTV